MAAEVVQSMAPEVVPLVAPVIKLIHQVPEPALFGNRSDAWPLFNSDVMAIIPGISYTNPVDPSFYGAGPTNLILPGPDMHGPTFTTTPLPPQPQPPPPLPPQSSRSTFRRSRWQADPHYGPFPPIEPCTTEPMKQSVASNPVVLCPRDGSDSGHASNNSSGPAKVQHITKILTSNRIYGTLQNTELVRVGTSSPTVNFMTTVAVLAMADSFFLGAFRGVPA